MNWVSWILFESVATLAAILGTAVFVLLVYWRRSGRRRPLLIGLGVAAGLLVLQSFIVTQREHAGQVLTAIENDLVDSRFDALGAALGPGFDAGGRDAEAFLAYVERQLVEVEILRLRRTDLRVTEAQTTRFAVSAAYWAEIDLHDRIGTVRSRWLITFVHTANGWRIGCIDPVRIDGFSDLSWESIDRR